jgi:hypothetical protein
VSDDPDGLNARRKLFSASRSRATADLLSPQPGQDHCPPTGLGQLDIRIRLILRY